MSKLFRYSPIRRALLEEVGSNHIKVALKLAKKNKVPFAEVLAAVVNVDIAVNATTEKWFK